MSKHFAEIVFLIFGIYKRITIRAQVLRSRSCYFFRTHKMHPLPPAGLFVLLYSSPNGQRTPGNGHWATGNGQPGHRARGNGQRAQRRSFSPKSEVMKKIEKNARTTRRYIVRYTYSGHLAKAQQAPNIGHRANAAFRTAPRRNRREPIPCLSILPKSSFSSSAYTNE